MLAGFLSVPLTPWILFRKGVLQPVMVKIAQRAGKKVVTLITNFEPFLIDPDALAESLRKSCASATSGRSPFQMARDNIEKVTFLSLSWAERGRWSGIGGPCSRESYQSRDGLTDGARDPKEMDREHRCDLKEEEKVDESPRANSTSNQLEPRMGQ